MGFTLSTELSYAEWFILKVEGELAFFDFEIIEVVLMDEFLYSLAKTGRHSHDY